MCDNHVPVTGNIQRYRMIDDVVIGFTGTVKVETLVLQVKGYPASHLRYQQTLCRSNGTPRCWFIIFPHIFTHSHLATFG